MDTSDNGEETVSKEDSEIRGHLVGGRVKKRKLTLKEIGRCHPRSRGKNKCLPDFVYRKAHAMARKTKKTRKKQMGRAEQKDEVYSRVGCAKGADHCLLDHIPMKEDKKKELRKNYLRPRKPKEWQKKPNMWLDNYNIQHVMKQYEEAYPWFHFLGVFPIDFSAPDPYRKNGTIQCLNRELCELNIKKEHDRGIRGIGMVFNLDPHYKGGSHWVALYINLSSIERPVVGFFDSYGYEVPEMIARFMRSLQLQVKDCVLGYNARRFQYGGSECGMFSLYFLICMIHGIHFDEFCKDALHDRSMLELRSILFSE
jgi:hypothetical protein